MINLEWYRTFKVVYELKLLWEGHEPFFNTFYFATKQHSKFQREIEQIEKLVMNN